MTIDLVDYKVDPYKEAMRDHLNGGGSTFFRFECHSRDTNILYDKACIFFTYLFNFNPFIPSGQTFFPPCLSISQFSLFGSFR
jgi:hypothetical protein